ncbi:MAG: hypothetical protein WA730_22700 [Pseudolabrys sp.]
MPKWQAAQKRRAQEFAELERRFGSEAANNQQSSDPVGLDAEEFSNLERNVFLISRHIGLLRQHESDFEKEGILIHESLEYWINAAQDIQTIFSNRDAAVERTSGNHRDAGSIVDTVWKQRGPGNTEASVRSMKAADALIVRSAPPVEPPDH